MTISHSVRCPVDRRTRLNTVLSYFNSLNPTHALRALPRFSLNEFTDESYGELTNEITNEFPDELLVESSLFC